jgi:hypothetical protein
MDFVKDPTSIKAEQCLVIAKSLGLAKGVTLTYSAVDENGKEKPCWGCVHALHAYQ